MIEHFEIENTEFDDLVMVIFNRKDIRIRKLTGNNNLLGRFIYDGDIITVPSFLMVYLNGMVYFYRVTKEGANRLLVLRWETIGEQIRNVWYITREMKKWRV